MRIDKFLKISRVLKKRSVAKKLADYEKVTINGKLAKPSSLVKIGDVVTVTFGEKELTFKIKLILTHPRKDEVDQLIEIMDASLSLE